MNATPPNDDRELEVLALQLTLGRYLVLKALEDGPKAMTDLAKIAQVSTAAMTGARDMFLAHGFVTDHRDAGDRRSVLVMLTERGEALLRAFEARIPTPAHA